MFFILKVLISGIVIAYASTLAGRNPVLAGFIIALPMMSILSILFSYFQFRDMERINQFAVSILWAAPLSLAFFIPFVLNKWLKMNFPLTFAIAMGCLVGVYFIHRIILNFWQR